MVNRFFTLTLASIAFTTIGETLIANPASAITLSVGGTNYDFTYVTGNFTDNKSTLESNPWWNNSSLTDDFLVAWLDQIGFSNALGGAGYKMSPIFAYGSKYPVVSFKFIDAAGTIYNRSNYLSVNTDPFWNWNGSLGYYSVSQIEPTVSQAPPADVPEPSTVVGSLLGLGYCWQARKRKHIRIK